MGIHTKIFLQFSRTKPSGTNRPNSSTTLPTTKGSYAVWQSLAHDSFLLGRGILYVTAVPN